MKNIHTTNLFNDIKRLLKYGLGRAKNLKYDHNSRLKGFISKVWREMKR